MPMLSTESPKAPPHTSASGTRLVPVAPSRWRVIDRSGRALGHVDASTTPEGLRYRARRYHPPSRSLRELGAFWSADDAIECLRLLR